MAFSVMENYVITAVPVMHRYPLQQTFPTSSSTIDAMLVLNETSGSNMMEIASDTAVYGSQFSRATTIFAAVAACIFTAVGVTGNLLTVLALMKSAKLRKQATTTFVISLAISDLLFCSINLPLTASRYVHEQWRLGETMCRLYPFFFYGNVGASLINMVAITFNRYVLISCPGNYAKIYSRLNILVMVTAVWLFSFGLLVPPLVEVWGSLGLQPNTFSCTVLRDASGRSPKKFLFLFGFFLPCLAIIICYSAIFYRVRQSRLNVQKHLGLNISSLSKQQKTGPATRQQASQRREDLRMTKMMLIIFISFLICFLPLMLVNVIDDELNVPTVHVVGSVLAWASAVINPFIYAFKNRQYKLAFVKLLHLDRRPGPATTHATHATSQASNHSKHSAASKSSNTEMIQLRATTSPTQSDRAAAAAFQNGRVAQVPMPPNEIDEEES